MQRDDFGNLDEWGRAVSQLEQLRRDRRLDEHQDDLVRLLRYPDNWRLREAALESAREIKQPKESLVTAVLQILTNEDLYYEARVLAAEALANLLPAARAAQDGRKPALEQRAIEQMHALLDAAHPPVLHQAVQRVLPTIE